MNRFKSTKKLFNCTYKEFLIRILFFLAAAVIAGYIIPREGKFRYIFNEGKPWKYGLLTAPYDFPIYKSEAVFAAEKDSILRYFKPYFAVDSTTAQGAIEDFVSYFRSISKEAQIPTSYETYVVNALNKAYQKGIISTADWEKIKKQKYTSVYIIQNKIATPTPSDDLYSEKRVYEEIVLKTPSNFNPNILQQLNISTYIRHNIEYDKARSEIAKEDILRQVPYAKGMVQAGERIIDRGEIVTDRTYNILRSLEIDMRSRKGNATRANWVLGGEFLVVTALFACMFLYLLFFRNETFRKKRLILFILLMIVGMILFSSFFARRSLDSIYVVPFAIIPLVIRTFFDSRTALFAHIITILICSIMAPFPYEFTLMQLTVGMTAIFSLKDLTQRSQIVRSALIIFLTYSIIYLGFSLLQEGDITKVKGSMYINFGINAILLLFTYLLIFLVEKVFGFVSNVTLVELSNINTPILRRFSEECPGTFQHSMQVANLAAAAAAAINANVQLARTGALFHDIGKMENPAFFTENQAGGKNPHDNLSCKESAHIIIDHVNNGVKIAQGIKLPELLIDFIRMHHGNGTTKYFYNQYSNEHPEEAVDEAQFAYPGPLPNTKETTILMMADAVEATSRSLKEYTEESISSVIERTIDNQMADGLYKESRLTFRDVEKIKQVFLEKLKNIYHTRISYPELQRQNKEKEYIL